MICKSYTYESITKTWINPFKNVLCIKFNILNIYLNKPTFLILIIVIIVTIKNEIYYNKLLFTIFI